MEEGSKSTKPIVLSAAAEAALAFGLARLLRPESEPARIDPALAAAAPTAALHFTPGLMAALAEAGIGHETLTLHVGAGTFLPVKADNTDDHQMHAEWGRIDPDTASALNAARAAAHAHAARHPKRARGRAARCGPCA